MKPSVGLIILFMVAACNSSKNVSSGEERLVIPCIENKTSNGVLRSHGIGSSTDITMAQEKAHLNARARLASSINVLVKQVGENYLKSTEVNNSEEALERFENLSQSVVEQQMEGVIVICEELTRSKSTQNITAYVSLELAGSSVLQSLSQAVNSDEMLKVDFNYEKMKKTFEEALKDY